MRDMTPSVISAILMNASQLASWVLLLLNPLFFSLVFHLILFYLFLEGIRHSIYIPEFGCGHKHGHGKGIALTTWSRPKYDMIAVNLPTMIGGRITGDDDRDVLGRWKNDLSLLFFPGVRKSGSSLVLGCRGWTVIRRGYLSSVIFCHLYPWPWLAAAAIHLGYWNIDCVVWSERVLIVSTCSWDLLLSLALATWSFPEHIRRHHMGTHTNEWNGMPFTCGVRSSFDPSIYLFSISASVPHSSSNHSPLPNPIPGRSRLSTPYFPVLSHSFLNARHVQPHPVPTVQGLILQFLDSQLISHPSDP